jgi:hypothetical protein
MNYTKAEELANWLETGEIEEIDLKEAAELLRQQALEIQALHQILGYEGIAVGREYLDECVEDLRKAQEK